MLRREDVDAQSAEVLQYFEHHSYEETAHHFGTSRGKVYKLVVAANRRKHEARIMERAIAKKQRQTEFLQEVLNSAVTCDVLDYLDGLPNNCAKMHLTSIPYNIGKEYGGSVEIDKRSFYFYLGWLLQVLAEMERTLCDDGILFLQVGKTRDREGNLYPLDILLFDYLKGMGLKFQSRIIWQVPHGLTPRRRLAERYEVALVFSKGDNPTFNPNAARLPQKEPDKRAFKGPNRGKLSGHPLGAFPSDVWYIAHCGSNHPDTKFGRHPAQFPLALAKRGILLYTMPGDLVIDVFSGSGTTLSAAKITGRAFSGSDLFYEDLRSKRLAASVPELFFHFPGVTKESLEVWAAEAHPVDYEPKRLITPEENEQLILGLRDDFLVEEAA